jgi:hypothetical protein
MDLRRLRIGDLIAGIAGVFLIVSLFLPWYGFDGKLPDGTPFALPEYEMTGWEALSWADVVLLAAGALGIALVVLTATQRTVAIPIALAALVTLIAIVAAVVVVYKLMTLPGPPAAVPEQLAPGVDAARRGGLWLAGAAVLLEFVGGAMAMRDERLSTPGRPTDITGRPVAGPPPVQTLPAPSGAGREPDARREPE